MKKELWSWSWLKIGLLLFSVLIFLTSSFLYLTPPGLTIRDFLAGTVITTQHRDWAWIFVGTEKRDLMVKQVHQDIEESATARIDIGMINHRKNRSVDELIKVEDISDKFWKGKLMYVYDPTSVRVIVPSKVGEGERISSMVERTGAVAGINGGGFIDPDGLGNGFAPIGLIMSDYKPLWTDADDNTAQYMIGFTEEGTLIVGKYSLNELLKLRVKEAVSFYAPRLIANGIPQITTGDGGWGRAPRTAVGQTEDGTLIMIIIDGRQAHSVGATLKEVQDLLLARGAVNAGLLDGGASSELVLRDGGLVTKPSSRWGERRLPSGLLVYDNPEDVVVTSPWRGLINIDPGGRHDHPDYLRDLQTGKIKEEPPANTRVEDPVVPTKPAERTPAQTPAAGTKPGGGATKPAANNTGAVKQPEAGTPDGTAAPGATAPGGNVPGAPAGTGAASPEAPLPGAAVPGGTAPGGPAQALPGEASPGTDAVPGTPASSGNGTVPTPAAPIQEPAQTPALPAPTPTLPITTTPETPAGNAPLPIQGFPGSKPLPSEPVANPQ
jgi:exopolysaccharide biosynthesis protein